MNKEIMSAIDDSADIRIYNYATKTVHTEKGLLLFKRDTETITCLGNECVEVYEQIKDKDNYIFATPIVRGKIYDYSATEQLIKWMKNKYVDYVDGKKRLFRRSKRVLIYLREPMSPIDKKAYEDLMYILGYRDILVLDSNTVFGGGSPEEAIWWMDENEGKFDCAIEITKDEPLGYARSAFEDFKKDCKRWGVDPAKVMDQDK